MMVESVKVLPWLGPSCSRNTFSILLVSPNKVYLENLSKALYSVHLERKNQWKLTVHCTADIGSILGYLSQMGPMSVDYVVICMDTSTVQCVDWAERTSQQVHPDLRAGRILLLNGSGLTAVEMAVSTDRLAALRRKLGALTINAALAEEREAIHAARRVHVTMHNALGLSTGLPVALAMRPLYTGPSDFSETMEE